MRLPSGTTWTSWRSVVASLIFSPMAVTTGRKRPSVAVTLMGK